MKHSRDEENWGIGIDGCLPIPVVMEAVHTSSIEIMMPTIVNVRLSVMTASEQVNAHCTLPEALNAL